MAKRAKMEREAPCSVSCEAQPDPVPSRKPRDIQTEPMNDIGEHPDIEAYVAWKNRMDQSATKALVADVRSWDGVRRCPEIFRRCESPAERNFLLGFFLANCDYEIRADEDGDVRIYRRCDGPDGNAFARLIPQVEVSGFEDTTRDCPVCSGGHTDGCTCGVFARIDFVVFMFCGPNVAIEVDGHEFHEKTKEQAASDKSRDRKITRCGYSVIRFTGSEVYRDPSGAVNEAIDTAIGLHEAMDGWVAPAAYEAYQRGYGKGYTARGTSIQVAAREACDEAAE
jgi:hypothetical protein